MTRPSLARIKRKAVWGSNGPLLAAAILAFGVAGPASASGHHLRKVPTARPGAPGSKVKYQKLDDEVARRAKRGNPLAKTSVIVTLQPGVQIPAEFKKFARTTKLDIINSVVLEVPESLLKKLEAHPDVFKVHFDRPIKAHNYLTRLTVGAKVVTDTLGYTGAGIGVAVIESGITTWHDDLTNNSSKSFPYSNQRVAKSVDFVNNRTQPYDDNGHGSHVAGTIAGNGYDSKGEKSGIAPGASIISLKVLDGNGAGTISRIIAALNWVALNYKTYNIRVVNMSVGAGVYESYWTDPLTLAAKAVTDKGVTVVAAAGNMGKNANGQLQWGA